MTETTPEPSFTVIEPFPKPVSLQEHLDRVYEALHMHSEFSKIEIDAACRQLSDKIQKQEWHPSWFQAETMPRSGNPVMDAEPRILLALAHIIYAREALHENGQSSAWSHLCEAYRWVGYFDRLSDIEVSAINRVKRAEAKREAAAAKAIDLKVKAIELFAKNRPPNGWANFAAALKAIKPELEKHIDQDAASDTDPIDVGKRMNHYKADPVFAAAFNSHASEEGQLPRPS